jgi:hypothetical protein
VDAFVQNEERKRTDDDTEQGRGQDEDESLIHVDPLEPALTHADGSHHT